MSSCHISRSVDTAIKAFANEPRTKKYGGTRVHSARPLAIHLSVRSKGSVLSSQIEGAQSSFSDLLLFESAETPSVPLEDIQEVSNYVAAMNHGLRRLREDFPLSLQLIREIHKILLSKGRCSRKHPGEFRETQNWIGGTRPGNAAQQAADTSKEILTLIEEDRRKIEEIGRPAASVLRVHQHLQRKSIITIPATADELSLSAPTVAKALQHMVKLSMVRETTAKQRHRLFTYHRYLEILNRGTEL